MIEIKSLPIYDKWFFDQTREVQAVIVSNLNRVKAGNTSNCESKRDGISEIKIHFGKGVRVYYIAETKTLFRLIWGGSDKKRQTADIEKAIKIKKAIRR
ncbi:MAG: type II toxin-antitoxin system RelE/ParE family toxin [Endomicrobium sp.]|nr:type II toxin-antitoxin system RelE/ParE family toxin [Endomicrobium sp.]